MHKPSPFMLKPYCPHCDIPILRGDIDVVRDTARCRQCGVTHVLSVLVGDGTDADDDADDGTDDVGDAIYDTGGNVGGNFAYFADLNRPPEGAWFRNHSQGVNMGAQRQMWFQFFFMVPFTLFWNIPVFYFFFPAVEKALSEGGEVMPALYSIPFLLAGLFMVGASLACVLGKFEITLRAGFGTISSKLWGIGWTREFEPEQVVEVGFVDRPHGNQEPFLRQRNGKVMRFARTLDKEQQAFFVFALRKVCNVRPPKSRRHR
jgi:hypothetical protein